MFRNFAKISALICTVALSAACVNTSSMPSNSSASTAPSAPAPLEGEHLLQPMNFPGGPWKLVHTQSDKVLTEAVWHEDRPGDNNIVQTFVVRDDSPPTLAQFKAIDEYGAKAHCAKAESHILKKEVQHGYKSLTWEATCYKPKGVKLQTSLNKAIVDKDAGYRVKKTWWPSASKKSWKQWLDYMNSVRVCDSRIAASKCRNNLEKVQ